MSCARLRGDSVATCTQCRTSTGWLECPPEARTHLTATYPPAAYSLRTHTTTAPVPRAPTHAQGYTGNVCTHCGSARMRQSGTCEVCDDCGESGACG